VSSLRAAATTLMLRPRAAMIRARSVASLVPGTGALAGLDGGPAHQSGARLVIGPRRTVVSDSRWRGVSPAQQVSFCGRPNRVMSPISAMKIAAKVGPIPLICWITRYPAMTAEPMSDHRPEHLNLRVVGIDQLQQGHDALAVDQIQRRRA
jgi:hypothetical protein